MRTGWLLSASFIALIGSLVLARADTFDDIASHLGAIEAAAPKDELSKASTDSITAVNSTVNAVNDAKARAAAAAADLVKAQTAAAIGNLPPDQAYQAQANKVAAQLDVIDGLKKMADSGNIKKNLDEAVANQKTAEFWANKAAQSVKETANLPATDPKRKEALDGYDNAIKLMAKAQYLAGVAADAAKAALNDPKSAESQLQAKIQGARADYNDMKSSLDKLNNVKNATVALQRANDDVTNLKSVAVAQGMVALNAVNADLKKADERKAAAAATKPAAPVFSNGGLVGHDGTGVVSQGGGNLVGNSGGTVISTNGSNLVSQGGGNLVSQGGGNLVGNSGGTVISTNGSNLVSQGGGNLVSQGGGNLVGNSVGNVISTNGSNLVSQGGGNVISNDGASFVPRGPEAYKAVEPSPPPAAPTVQDKAAAVATAALTKAQDAAARAQTVATVADQAYKDVSKSVIRPADFDTRVAVDVKGAAMAVSDADAKSKATQALLTAANNGDPQGTVAAALGKPGQKLTQNDLAILRDKAVADSKASFFQQDLAAGGYAEKYARANFADADLASAKAARDTLTTLAGKVTDPAQLATLNAAIATATVVQQAAQAKSDQLNADASIVRLQASIRDGNQTDAQKQQSWAELARLQGVSTTSQATLATIVKNNPQVAPVAAVAANNVAGGTLVPIVDALKNAVVAPALKQLSRQATTAAQAATAAVQQANTAVQQANTAVQGGASKQASTITANSNFDATQTSAALAKASASLNDKRVASLASTAGSTSTAAPTSTSPAQQGAIAHDGNSLVAPAIAAPVVVATAPATSATAALSTTPGVSKPAELVNDFTAAANAIGFAQQFKKPDGTPDQAVAAEYIGKLATRLSPEAMNQWVNAANGKGAPSQLAMAELRQAQDASQLEMLRERAAGAASGPASTAVLKPATPAVFAAAPTANTLVAPTPTASVTASTNTAPPSNAGATRSTTAASTPVTPARSTPLVVATAPAAPTTSTPATSSAVSRAADTAPTKITTEQNKAIQQALRTIPGRLSSAEKKTFSALSTLADRAATKGLTPEEATTVKNCLKALAEKHPNTEKQHELTSLVGTIASSSTLTSKLAVGLTTPAAAPVTMPAAVALPSGNVVPGGADKTARSTPAIAVPAATARHSTPLPDTRSREAMRSEPTHQPAAPKAPENNTQAMRTEPKSQPVAPKASQNSTPPKPAVAAVSSSQNKPVVPKPQVASKPQTCTPNMQSGKMMGMICH